jgi:ribokinase
MTVTGTLEKLELLPNLTSVLFQLEIPFEVTLACMKRCRERGIVTFFTPAPVPPDGLSDEFFKFSSVVVPNLGEALQLSGGRGTSSDDKGLETTPSLTEAEIRIKRATVAAQTIINRGANAVCVTLGKEGVLLAMSVNSNEGNEEAKTTRVLAIPAPRVARVVDTTGAGDAFSGSFAYFYSDLLLLSSSSSPTSSSISNAGQKQGVLDWDLLVGAAKRAVFVASLSVTKKGTQSSYARRDELPIELFQADGDSGDHEKEKKEEEGVTSKKWVLPVNIE